VIACMLLSMYADKLAELIHCLQWTHHLKGCTFTSTIRLGQAIPPGIESWRSNEEMAKK